MTINPLRQLRVAILALALLMPAATAYVLRRLGVTARETW